MNRFLMILAFVLVATYTASVNSEECPTWYRRYSNEHTYCKPKNEQCEILDSGLPYDDQEIILMEHNRYRSMVAMEEAENLPGAANMLQMEWDDELAEIAQRHANRCSFKHDCADCRKVKNFAVGQNIAMDHVSTVLKPPEPDWFGAIYTWWKEREHFKNDCISPYIKPQKNRNYAHFSQLVWAGTWRVGCGYSMYKEGKFYKRFYVCNYGPEGNLLKDKMYESGTACSQCPENTCCGDNCDKTEYMGLCKLYTGKRPVYKPKGDYLMFCNFEDSQQNCGTFISGANKWRKFDTLSGKYLGTVIEGGEETKMTMKQHLKPKSDLFCFCSRYRKGPDVSGDDDALDASINFHIIEEKQTVEQPVKNWWGVAQHRFNLFCVTFDWNLETEVSIAARVPKGEKAQYFDISEVYALDGECPED